MPLVPKGVYVLKGLKFSTGSVLVEGIENVEKRDGE
jgi:hypothetical protein